MYWTTLNTHGANISIYTLFFEHGSEWCRVTHNHQLLICSNCNEAGHSRKNCLQIQRHNCNQLGHISYHCPLRVTYHTETANNVNTTTENNTTEQNVTEADYSDLTMEEPPEQNDLPDEEQASTSTIEKIMKIKCKKIQSNGQISRKNSGPTPCPRI